MLRHYDELGLLEPGFVDASSGYRYYKEEQLLTANRIQVLKAMGFGLKEIAEILHNGIRTEAYRKLLSEKADEKKMEIKKLRRQSEQLEHALLEFNNQEEFTCSISIKTIPSRKVVSFRSIIGDFSEEGILWGTLQEECKRQNVRFAYPDYALAIEHAVDFETCQFDTEVQRCVEQLYLDTDKIKFFEASPVFVASFTYQGGYDRLNQINPYVANWILANHYEICGAVFNIYHRSPEREEKEENFITEVCYPIKERN
jgi:Predicted transcriptional regulators